MFNWLKRGPLKVQPDELDLAAYDLCSEVREGLWNAALSKVSNRQPAASADVVAELQRRCPGHSTADYQRALAKGMLNSR